ncbi:enoyl-CoA hydratase/isomerase family protein [Sporobolomyces koalae]|uniref:enoyl-CoA hydratase/isomerase family protein n=1 Tax=Sporobolomyces koalae TaxID=500713 RepID=UPI00316AF104
MQHPSVGPHLVVTFPLPKVLQLRLNRPEALNAMTDALEEDLREMLDWFEEENSLWTVVITGTGRAFCAGQDLKDWQKTAATRQSPSEKMKSNPHGFGSLARRRSKKPIIIAINGTTMGGGAEAAVNGDIVIGCEGAKFGFPEVLRGVVASVGGIPNAFLRSPMFSPYLLSGVPIPAELLKHHLFADVVPADKVLPVALEWAKKVTAAAPDAVWATKAQINSVKDGKGVWQAVAESLESDQMTDLFAGANHREGLDSFVQKRATVFTDPVKRSSKL